MSGNNKPQDWPPLKQVIQKYDLRASKRFGQNFLLDSNITDKIAQSARAQSKDIFEIGPGPGGLTRSLLKIAPESLCVIELDRRMIAPLEELAASSEGKMRIIQADALAYEFPENTRNAAIVANLPYNIATALLLKWLGLIDRDPNIFESMTLLFQKEVAQRLTARPREAHYGRLAVISQYLCKVERVFDIPPGAFSPAPKVTSTLVRLEPLEHESETPRPKLRTLEDITRSAFGQRRKMIRSSLKGYKSALKELDIDITKRAEELTVNDYISIANFVDQYHAGRKET